MRFIDRRIIHIVIIVITMIATSPLFGQVVYPFMTPAVDSICRNTLEYVQIKQLLLRQQELIGQEMQQLENTLKVLNQDHSDIVIEQRAVEEELAAINRHLDSLTPKRPEGPRPRENIITIINERTSFHGNYGLNLNQLALSNWAAGGESSASIKAFANLNFTYRNKKSEQKLSGAFAFGTSRFSDKHLEKSDDKIDIQYSVAPITLNKSPLSFSMVSTFSTQFAEGYKYPNDSTMLSCFFAPAYLTLSGGYNYKTKNENLHVYVSPIAGKATFVMNQELADKGSYGVKKGYYDADSIWVPGEHVAAAVGINVIVNYKQPIGKNITYTTMLNAFYNYVETKNDNNRLRLDFNWESTINFVISKYITTILFVHLKYDHNTLFPVYETVDGVETVVDNVPKLQFKESLGIAFVHNF